MSTVQDRLNNRKILNVRGNTQTNDTVLLARYNKGLQIFQKEVLERVSNNLNTKSLKADIIANKSVYDLPFDVSERGELPMDFYSIIQLNIAYKADKEGTPMYKVANPISLHEYDISEKSGYQKGKPHIWNKTMKIAPKFTFINKGQIKIFPTPTEDVDDGILIKYNFIQQPVELNTDEDKLFVPWYFLDVIDDYLTYMLYRAENPELAGEHKQNFIDTLHNNIYGLNRTKGPVDEEFANLSYFNHN